MAGLYAAPLKVLAEVDCAITHPAGRVLHLKRLPGEYSIRVAATIQSMGELLPSDGVIFTNLAHLLTVTLCLRIVLPAAADVLRGSVLVLTSASVVPAPHGFLLRGSPFSLS